MNLMAEVQAYSSVVGAGVSLKSPDGATIGEVMFINRSPAMADKTLQLRLSEIIAAAINASGDK